jgi:GMP synthase (glutamine-hydrolysing)
MRFQNKSIKVAIVDNSIDSSVYQPVDHWRKWLSVPWVSFRARKNEFPDFEPGFTHFILTGSEASILEREKWVEDEVALVQEAVERGLPVLGSCYGHQLLALALRGPGCVRRCPNPEIGWIPVMIPAANSLLGDKGSFFTFSSHFDEVVNLDREFRVLAATGECPVQGFELVGKQAWGLQFHPEIDIDDARVYLRNIILRNRVTRAYFEKALKETPRDSGLILRIVSRFLESGAKARSLRGFSP